MASQQRSQHQDRSVASNGNAKYFDNGRQLSAWLSLELKHYSTGGKCNLLSSFTQTEWASLRSLMSPTIPGSS
jgi:hypothetical protein